MRRHGAVCWGLLGMLLWAWAASAAARTWTDTTGQFQIEAELVRIEGDAVRLKKSDGSEISVPLAKLCQADRALVARQSARKATPHKLTDPPAIKAAEPAAAKAPAKTGRFTTTFSSYSPLGKSSLLLPRMMNPGEANQTVAKLRAEQGKLFDYYYKLKEQSWQIYVPEDYDGTLPFGLLLFIESSDETHLSPDWLPALKRHHLILSAADRTGNKEDAVLNRVPLALDALYNLSQQYRVDPDRIYVSGCSGGGRAASWAAMAFADVFSGGLYICDANFYRTIPDGAGAIIPALIYIPSQQAAVAAQQRSRYVYLTGEKDMNRQQMQATCAAMVHDGFRHATYLEVPGMGHSSPNDEWFEKAIVALDEPLREGAKAALAQASKLASRKQLGEAMLAYDAAAAHGRDEPFVAEAKAKHAELARQYDQELSEIEQLVRDTDRSAASKLSAFRKRWGKAAQNNAQRLLDAVKKQTMARKSARGGAAGGSGKAAAE